ncbi:MAG: Maf family nucleotide pyrophosphatase [Bacteroidota bacterium]
MLREQLKDHRLILASGSPRRKYFFDELDLEYVQDVREVDEVYPDTLQGAQITDYLAQLKASVFHDLERNDLLVTADTIVWKDGRAIGKPVNAAHAARMLQDLSGEMHEVYSSVCFTTVEKQITVNDCTRVWFKPLTDEEIEYYISHHQPFDKAGSYGIQDWLGYIAIERLEGSYFNVMGLPTRLVYKTLMEMAL